MTYSTFRMPASRTRRKPSTSEDMPCQDKKGHLAPVYVRSNFALDGETATHKKYQYYRNCSYSQTEFGRILRENNDEKLQAIVKVRWRSKAYIDTYLNGNAGEYKEVEFQEANQHFVVLVHCLEIARQ